MALKEVLPWHDKCCWSCWQRGKPNQHKGLVLEIDSDFLGFQAQS